MRFRVSAILPRGKLEHDKRGGQDCLEEEKSTAAGVKALYIKIGSLTQSVRIGKLYRANSRRSLYL